MEQEKAQSAPEPGGNRIFRLVHKITVWAVGGYICASPCEASGHCVHVFTTKEEAKRGASPGLVIPPEYTKQFGLEGLSCADPLEIEVTMRVRK